MRKIENWALDFHSEMVTDEICIKYGFDEQQALRKFLSSKTYQMLLDYDTALYKESHLFLFDMWEAEQVTGDPRNSVYIRLEH